MTTIQEKCWVQGLQSEDVFGAVYEALFELTYKAILDEDVDVEASVDTAFRGLAIAFSEYCFGDTVTRRLGKDAVYVVLEKYKQCGEGWQLNDFISEHLYIWEVMDDIDYEGDGSDDLGAVVLGVLQ